MEEKKIDSTERPESGLSPHSSREEGAVEKMTFWQRVKQPGSVWQIIGAALLAIAIGLAVATTVDEVPEAVPAILNIPGDLWLRSLKAVGKCQLYLHS